MIDYSLINNCIFIDNIISAISTTKKDILEDRGIKVTISALMKEEYEDNMIAEQDFAHNNTLRP
jgi:hypothetical protein